VIRSIRGRLLILAAMWLSVALVGAFLLISGLLRDFVTDRFDAEAMAVADSLTGQLESDDGQIELDDEPTDARFSLPFSGWYWQVTADGTLVARSASLLDGSLADVSGEQTGVITDDADGASLRLLRREVTIPDSDSVIGITVTVPMAQIEDSLHQVIRPLAVSLAVLGLGLAMASVIQVTSGLKSLGRLRTDLARVRAGDSPRLAVPDVSELRPLTAEINAALNQNETLLTRSRHHLGNLAHSLKTPLAALSNDLPVDHSGQELIARMDRLIGWHLRRARQAGGPVLGQRTLIAPVIDDILLVLRWPMQDKGMTADITCPHNVTFPAERQDLEEMVGNLCENAVKWGNIRMRVSVTQTDAALTLTVEDDGPGLTDGQASKALMRGGRLDEHGPPGAGLGLAIVADLAALHGGELRLERSDLGGLAAIVHLPA
jgi:signal transduction histidine kinase